MNGSIFGTVNNLNGGANDEITNKIIKLEERIKKLEDEVNELKNDDNNENNDNKQKLMEGGSNQSTHEKQNSDRPYMS
jgi:TolA-binding protein